MASIVNYAARNCGSASAGALPRWIEQVWPPVLGMVVLVLTWEAVVFAFDLPNFVLPLPQEILSVAAAQAGHLWENAATTVLEALVGFATGSLFGFLLAVLMVLWRSVERIVLPPLVIVNAVPMVAFGPLVTIWFGIGMGSKVVLIFVVVSYTVLINALAGLKACDAGAVALLRSFGASDLQIVLVLRLPGALPAIFAGLKVAVVHSMILAIVVEMLGAYSGLGWSIYQSTQMMNFVEAWAAVLVAVVISLVLYGLVVIAAQRAIWWPR